ncbi:hypothetical protein E8E11_005881 [Didymella keratinophila]|nr:hypothetical protein E8E11_005881 [Didymella keratinophila]
MSDNFDHTVYALQPAALSEDPSSWDWAALKEEVDASFAGNGEGDWYHEITLESLQEEPPIASKTGARAFPRKDKLHEHILAGHDDDTLFKCPDDHGCVVHITRDYLALHGETSSGLQKFRKCPIPKCSFKLNAAR